MQVVKKTPVLTPGAFAEFNNLLPIISKRKESETGATLGSFGLKIRLKGDYSELIASLSLAAIRVEKLRETAKDMKEAAQPLGSHPEN